MQGDPLQVFEQMGKSVVVLINGVGAHGGDAETFIILSHGGIYDDNDNGDFKNNYPQPWWDNDNDNGDYKHNYPQPWWASSGCCCEGHCVGQ